jgi:lysosomal alpha-mannosidase
LYFSKIPKYIDTNGFEIETLVGSINVTDKIGKEIILSFATTIQNNKTFYTDSNGMEEQKRVIDKRPTWPLIQYEPASGNYYPVNSHISIIDTNSKQRFNLLVDRSQGGSVIRDGNVEIMIQRRTTMDDARGVGEPLNEPGDGPGITQKVRHYAVLGNNNRAVQKANDQRIVVSWANTASSTFAKYSPPKPAFTVPDFVKLYLRPFSDDSYLLRLMNFDTSKNVIYC